MLTIMGGKLDFLFVRSYFDDKLRRCQSFLELFVFVFVFISFSFFGRLIHT